jgi:hypothetical protein
VFVLSRQYGYPIDNKLYKGIKDKIDLKKLIEAQTKFLKSIDGDRVLLIKEFIQIQSGTMMLLCTAE